MGTDERPIPLEETPLRVICAGCQRPVSAAVTVESEKGRLCPDCAAAAEEKPSDPKSSAA